MFVLYIGSELQPRVFPSFAEVSAAYCRVRDEGDFDSSVMPQGDVYAAEFGGPRVAVVGYNGRVWPPSGWKSGIRPLFDPCAR